MTKQDHLDFIKREGTFNIECNTAIFSIEVIQCLEKYGHWFKGI